MICVYCERETGDDTDEHEACVERAAEEGVIEAEAAGVLAEELFPPQGAEHLRRR